VDLHDVDLAVAVGATVLLLAVLAVRLSVRVGVPGLLAYLALGLALGEGGLGIPFEDFELAHVLGLLALALILAEGGLTTRLDLVRPVLPMAAALASVGVLVSVAVVAAPAHLLLGLDLQLALLLGAAVSSTDAAAVFATLRQLRLPPRLVGLLEGESGTNDPLAVILVVGLSASTGVDPGDLAVEVVVQVVIGAAIGLGAGAVGVVTLRRGALPSSGLYPIAVLAFALLGYSVAALAHGSGFLAVYLAALVLGNADLPHRPATLGFAEGVGWLAQIGLFTMLGLLASPDRLLDAVWPALVVGVVLLLVARPLSVAVCLTPFRVPLRRQAFVSWAGLRGAVPIVLATIPLTQGMADGEELFDIVFVLVVVFTLVQGPTLAWVADRLGVVAEDASTEVVVDSAPLDELGAVLLQLRIPPGSRLHGVEVAELRLPPGSSITLVVRAGTGLVPVPTTRLRTGDRLLVVATPATRRATERRLRAVSLEGRLAGWHRRTDGADGARGAPARGRVAVGWPRLRGSLRLRRRDLR
jgi:potassium/hydrogen antiporter